MINLNQYREIKRVRDQNPFTSPLSLTQYIQDVKWRMSNWYGIKIEDISDEDVYSELIEKSIKISK